MRCDVESYSTIQIGEGYLLGDLLYPLGSLFPSFPLMNSSQLFYYLWTEPPQRLTNLPISILHSVKVTKYVFSLSKECEKKIKNDLALVHFHFIATPKLPFPRNSQPLLFFLSFRMMMSCTQNLHHSLSQNQNNLLKSNLLHRHDTLSSCVPHTLT